jgi:hypothetical protein
MTTTTARPPSAARAGLVYCRMQDMHGDRCTGEALSATADVQICRRHAALVMELVNRQVRAIRPAGRVA